MDWIKRHTALTLFFLVLVVGFALSLSIGPAWDEPDNIFAGGVYVSFFTHGADPSYFRILTDKASAYGDRIIPNDHQISHYPPLPNYIGSLFVSAAAALHIQMTAPAIIIGWHLATVVFFALMVAMTYRFGLLLGLSVWSSLFAAIGVFLYPQLFGHGLSNLKDTAQVALVITSLYYLVRASKGTEIKIKDLFIGAAVWGLGMATKFNAVYVPIIWGIWFLSTARKHIILTMKYVFIVCIVGLITMFFVWPYLWFDTIQHVIEVVKYFTTIGQGYRVIWDGVWYTVGVGKSLWWYPIMSFFYTTPAPLLLLIFFGGFTLIRHVHNNPVWVLLPIWILMPLVRLLSPWSAFYDLTRHFLEIMPAIVLVAAIGADWFFQKKQHLKFTGIMISAIILGHMFFINISMFPYSTGYYNFLARDPNTNFDRDIEGFSVKEGMDWLHQTYGSVRVWVPIAAHLSWPYLISTDRYIYTLEGEPDSIIIVNKQTHGADRLEASASGENFTLVHTISRGTAVFGWVYRRASK